MNVEFFVNTYLKLFFLLTPFFVMSMFLAMTHDLDTRGKHKMAMKVTLAVMVLSFALCFVGKYVFQVFGITLDAFRIGAGTLLFLSAIGLVQGGPAKQEQNPEGDISVVPLAIPITVGPATIGTLLVMSAEVNSLRDRLQISGSLFCAILTVGILLYMSSHIERYLGQTRLLILTKLTGLILSAIAAQMIFTGIRSFLH